MKLSFGVISLFTLTFQVHEAQGGLLASLFGDKDSNDDCSVVSYTFQWRGQFAGFIVNGRFSYDTDKIPDSGIVREEDLLKLDVSFYDPQGNLLRTYTDNHLSDDVNFAFDHLAQELLQDGTFNVDDEELRYRNGFVMGAGDPSLRSMNGVQTGLAFWSRPGDDKVPHLHVDDWNDKNGQGEFEFPIGYSSHEDAGFMYKTTQDRIDTGKVGLAYFDESASPPVNKLASDLEAMGRFVSVTPVDADMALC